MTFHLYIIVFSNDVPLPRFSHPYLARNAESTFQLTYHSQTAEYLSLTSTLTPKRSKINGQHGRSKEWSSQHRVRALQQARDQVFVEAAQRPRVLYVTLGRPFIVASNVKRPTEKTTGPPAVASNSTRVCIKQAKCLTDFGLSYVNRHSLRTLTESKSKGRLSASGKHKATIPPFAPTPSLTFSLPTRRSSKRF